MDYLPANFIKVKDFSKPKTYGFNHTVTNYKELSNLKATLFLSLRIHSYNNEKRFHELLKKFNEILSKEIIKLIGEGYFKYAEIEMEEEIGRRRSLLVYENFAFDFYESGLLQLVMPVDLVQNYYETRKNFKNIAESLIHNTCEIIGDERKLSIDFIYDFEGGIEIDSGMLEGTLIDDIINNRQGLRVVKDWLIKSYRSN